MTPILGTLYLIPNTLGETPPLEVLPLSVKKIVEEIDYYIVEHEKNARKFIKHITPQKSQPDLHIQTLNKFTNEAEIPNMLQPCFEGFNMGIISDAGCPGVADPGAAIVAEAHRQGIKVVPLVGPSSILLALMASGFNGQNFAFNGYLPIDKRERRKEIKRLERLSEEQNQAQLFIETPYRNNQLLESIISTLQPQSKLCIACDLTLPTEFIRTLPAFVWKKTKVNLDKRPTLFIIQK